ncbi:MAG: tRNA uridine-5-carboxymethylaminomethyl(34) synthesis GTPase MnmE [Actinomycetota bacterium]
MYLSEKDTIAAIGTNPGEAAIGIVKLSGEDAVKIADKIFRSKSGKKIKGLNTYSLMYGEAVDSKGKTVDEVVVGLMKKPNSYTREDVVEINAHGGIVATSKVLNLCLDNGARLAQPGEFTKRAFLNGRIDLSQAEAVIDIIRSKTEESLKIAANNIKGNVKKEIEKIRNDIIEVLVQLEASVDFIEEDLELTPYEELRKTVGRTLEKTEKLIEDEKKGEIVKNGVKVAIVGKPNVGKSSLLNLLVKKEKAIVTAIPGTTRDAVEEIIYISGIPLIMIDTAGIRKTISTIEKIGVERSLKHIDEAEIVLMVIDGSKQIDFRDLKILERAENKNTIAVINKIDLGIKIEKMDINKFFKEDQVVYISAIKKEGIENLEELIKKKVLGNGELNLEEKIIINNRHKRIMIEAKNLLENADKAMAEKMSEEFAAADLKIAVNILGEITGQTAGEEVLEKIFSQFCIGK